MSLSIDVFVAGTPKGQPRPRAFSRGGKASVYDPATAEGWKSEIALALRKWANTQHVGPVVVTMTFYFRRPKGHQLKSGLLKPTAPKWYTSRPDADNLEKAVLDACTQIGLWKDDAQVVELVAHKVWSAGTGQTGMALRVGEAYEPSAEERTF
jgi:Holliday junction resolvase RusA-like endonuclease